MPSDFDLITGLSTTDTALLQQDTQNRIRKLFANVGPVNQLQPSSPVVPTNGPGDPPVQLSQQERSDLAIKRWLNESVRADKDLFSGAGNPLKVTATGTDRYLSRPYGYNPARDNEDFYAQQQKWYAELPKAVLLKFPALVLSKTGTGIGYLAGLADPSNWKADYITNAADNGFARIFENFEDNIKNKWLPTYQEAADRDKGFFARAFTDLNFWTEDVVDGAAFMASAFVPGMTLAKLGTGAKAAALLTRLGIAGENGTLGRIGLQNIAAYMRNAQTAANLIDKSLMVGLSTAGEAMWEAKQVRDNIITGFTARVNPATGRTYTEPEARQIAGQAAMNTFLLNMAALSVSNLWETNLLYNALGKGKNAAARLTAGRLGEGYQAAAAASGAGHFFNSRTGRILESALAGTAVEGFWEENIQLAIQRVYEQNGNYKGGVLNQYLYQTLDAIKGKDTEAAMNIGLGAVLGIAGGAIVANSSFNRENQLTASLRTALEQGEKDFLKFGDLFIRDQQGEVKTDYYGKPIMDTGKVASMVSSWQQMASLKDAADNTSDPTMLAIYKNEQLSRWAKAALDAGNLDLVYKKLDDATRYTDKELVELGFDPASNPNRMQEVTHMQAYLRSLKELYESLYSDILKAGATPSALHSSRKNYLFTLGARQLGIQQIKSQLDTSSQELLSRINSTVTVSATDTLVDKLNFIAERISQQKSLLESLSGYDLDGADTNRQQEESLLEDLLLQQKDLINQNKKDVDSLIVNPSGRYLYQQDTKNKAILNKWYQNKIKDLAAIENVAASLNAEFYRVADVEQGENYFLSQTEKKLQELKADVQSILSPEPAAETPTGKSAKVIMANNTPGGPDIEVELEEGKNYLGQLSGTPVASGKGLTATIFRNDNIRVISVSDDGNVTLTINGDSAVTFTRQELRQIPAIKGLHTLTPLQQFYIKNRNKVFYQRIPVKFNPETKKWESRIVSGRISYNKEEDRLDLVYKQKGKLSKIEFNPRFVTRSLDLGALSDIEKQGLDQQKERLDRQYKAQVQLFENLINHTEAEIAAQKERSEAINARIKDLDSRIADLNKELDAVRTSFEKTDQSKISDKRSKAARLSRTIVRIENEITEIASIKEELTEDLKGLAKRRAALEFYQDQYYQAYDELTITTAPMSRADLDYQTSRLEELRFQESRAGILQDTTAQIEGLLESTVEEERYLSDNKKKLENYEKLLQNKLEELVYVRDVIQILLEHPQKAAFRTWLKQAIRQETNPYRSSQLKSLFNKVSSNPQFFDDISWLAGSLRDTRLELEEISFQQQQASDNLKSVQGLSSLRNETNFTLARINQLKDIFSGLTLQFRRDQASAFYHQTQAGARNLATARTIEDAKRLSELENLFSTLLTEPPADFLEEEKLFFSDTASPVMTAGNNPLFKSADSHYPSDQLNPQLYTRRFFKFTSQVAMTPDLFLLPVTADNDGKYGQKIRYEADLQKYPDDIKLVVVRKKNGVFHPVDMEGNVLSSPDANNIVYTSMYGHRDLLNGNREKAIEWARKNFVTRDLTDDQVYSKITQYLQTRNWIKEQIKAGKHVYLSITGKSNGIQNRVPKNVITGLPQQLAVEGRLTSFNPDWSNVDLVVSSTDGQITGSTGVKIKPGRVVIRRDGNIIQVYNRKLIDQEKERIKRILKRLSVLMGTKATYDKLIENNMRISDTEQQQYTTQINQVKLLTQHLSSILYWRGPKEGVPVSGKQWYVSSGRLYKGDKWIPFTPDAIEDKLDNLLEDVYHQVAAVLLSENYKNQSYNVLDVTEDGKLLTTKKYGSYKEYLLTSIDRQAEQIPVYTNIVNNDPANSDLPQLKNSYLRYSLQSEDASMMDQQARLTASPSLVPGKNKSDEINPPGKYVFTFENSKGTVALSASLVKDQEFTLQSLTATKGELNETRRELMETFILALNNRNNKIFQDEGTTLTGEEYLEDFRKRGSKISLASFVEPQPSEGPTLSNTGGNQDQISQDAKALLDDINNFDTGFNVDYRIADMAGTFTYKEDIDSVKKWFKTNLPQFSVNIVDQLIDGKAWGAFRNGAIYLYDQAERGTAYHEAFEAVYRSFLTPAEIQTLTAEFKTRSAYRNQLDSLAELYPLHQEQDLIREALAEEFREYVLSGGNQKTTFKGADHFFARLWRTIKAILGLSVAQESAISALFNKIQSGYYSSWRIGEKVDATVSYRKVGTITSEVMNYTIEGIAALFFNILWRNDTNTTVLQDKRLGSELVNNIWREIGQQLKGGWSLTALKVAAVQLGYLSKDQVKQTDNIVAGLIKALPGPALEAIAGQVKEFERTNIINRKDQVTILDNFNTVVFEAFTDYLKQFGFSLQRDTDSPNNENPETSEEEAEQVISDPLGIRDTLTIDTRNTASLAVRLLVASLTNDYYSSDGGIYARKDPYMGLPRLVDYNSTINLLFSELSNIVPVYQNGILVSGLQLMSQKLLDRFKDPVTGRYKENYLWIDRMLRRLKVIDKSGEKVQTESLSLADIQLQIAFVTTFTKNRHQPSTLVVAEDSYLFSTDPVQAVARDRVVQHWENAVKSNYSTNPFVKLHDNKISFNKDSAQYNELLNSSDPYQKLEFLRKIGITFSAPDAEIVQGKYTRIFSRAFESIRTHIKPGGEITTTDELFSRQIVNGPINALVSIENDYNGSDIVLSYRNPEGKTEYSIVTPSTLSNIVNSLQGTRDIRDFVMTNPQYGVVNTDGTISLHPYQQNSMLLRRGGQLFDTAGKKIKDINVFLISGLTGLQEDGSTTANLKRSERAIQEIHYLLKGIFITVVNSDKNSEFGIDLGEFVPMFEITASPEFIPAQVVEQYQRYLTDEVNSLKLLSSGYGKDIQHFRDSQYNKKTGAWELTHFKEIVTSAENRKLLQQAIRGESTVEELTAAAQQDIEQYLTGFIERQQEALIRLGIIERNADGTFSTNAISREELSRFESQGLDLNPDSFNQVQFSNLSRYLFFNHQIGIIEQHKFLFGHPALYKDLPKRSSGLNSTRAAIADDPEIRRWMDLYMPRPDGKSRIEDFATFRLISLDDNIVIEQKHKEIAENLYRSALQELGSKEKAETKVGARFNDQHELTGFIRKEGKATGDIAAYLDLNEADGQAYILPSGLRDILFLSSKFSALQMAQWEYETAYERNKRSQLPATHFAFQPYTSAQKNSGLPQKDEQIVTAGSPGAIFPVLKPQYFGYQKSSNHMLTTFLKHSVQPKFYRFVENTEFLKVYIQAQQQAIDIIGFGSGQKIGNRYRDDGGFTNMYLSDTPMDITGTPVQTLYHRFYGIQLETTAATKSSVVRGTQMTKQILSNLYKAGSPLHPQYQELVSEYHDTLERLTRYGKQELLDELGIEVVNDGGYSVINVGKLVTLLREEAIRRDLPDNMVELLDAMNSSGSLDYTFDALPNRDKIENILAALVDSRIISPMVYGKAAVQVSSSFYETLGSTREIIYLDENSIYQKAASYASLTAEQKKTVRIASSDLSFYKLEGSKITAMEVYLPHWFKGLAGKNIDIRKLDPRLLRAIGYRIPTQSLSSIDFLVVKGFLNPEEGDTVVVPSSLVGKSGSDFDIDKLNIILPNYYVQETGYGSEHFKTFMLQDLIAAGFTSTDAGKIMNAFTVEDFIKINRATYTQQGKVQKGAIYSLEDLTQNVELVALVKKSLTNYNTRAGGSIRYVEPGTDSKEALQNKWLELSWKILELPENYRQLIMPNGAPVLKQLATEISAWRGQETQDGPAQFTRLAEWEHLNLTREQFLVSKRLVGIGALHLSNHVISQLAGIMVNDTYRQQPVTLRFAHNKTQDGHISLSDTTNTAGYYISDLLSEVVTASVDAAKDPFIFSINITPATAGTFLYLLRAGVTADTAVYFINQPLILKYLELQQKNESIINKINRDELSKQYVYAQAISSAVQKAFPGLIKDRSGNPSSLEILLNKAIEDQGELDYLSGAYVFTEKINFFSSLKDANDAIEKHIPASEPYNNSQLSYHIKKYGRDDTSLSQQDAIRQLLSLNDFLTYQQHASALTDYMNAVNYDTFSSKSTIENKIQEFNFKKAINERFILSPQAVIANTFIGELQDQKQQVEKVYGDMFVSLKPQSKRFLQPIFDFIEHSVPHISTERKKDILNRYQNFFLTYLLQNVPGENPLTGELTTIGHHADLLFGDKTLAQTAFRLKADRKYADNKFMQQVFPLIATERGTFTDNLKIFVSKQSAYEMNQLADSLEALIDKRSQDKDLAVFIDNLVSFAILQSGLQLSPITFTRLLPNRIYTRYVQNIFNTFLSSFHDNLAPQIIYKQFFQNNYYNPRIVPKVEQRFVKNGIVELPVSFMNSNFDYVSVNRNKLNPVTGKPYSKSETLLLTKQRKWDTLYDKELYEKFAQDDHLAYYRRINKLGNKIYAIETYSRDTAMLTEEDIQLSPVNGFVDEGSSSETVLKIQARIENNGPRDVNNQSQQEFINKNTCM